MQKVWVCGAILLAMWSGGRVFALAGASGTAAPSSLKLSGRLTITRSTRIEPGQYHLDVPDGQAVTEIAADNVVLDMTGVTLESSARQPWERVGMGIHAKGYSQISTLGAAIHGYARPGDLETPV